MILDKFANLADFLKYFIVYVVTFYVLIGVAKNLWYRLTHRCPPGPWGLPLLGYLTFLGDYPYLTLGNLSKKYGNVIGLTLGSRYVVILNDYPGIKEACQKDAFLGRAPDSPFSAAKSFTQYISDISGPLWKEHRRFALHALKDMGVGKRDIEDYMRDELTKVLEEFLKFEGKPFDVSKLLKSSVSNVVTVRLFGKRFDYKDPIRRWIDKSLDDVYIFIGQAAVHCFFPWLREFLIYFNLMGYQHFIDVQAGMEKFIVNEIDEHESTYDENITRDFTDRYLHERYTRLKTDPHTTYSREMLKGNIGEFLAAGSETSSNSLRWALLLMAAYPGMQKKVQAEVDDVIGQGRLPCWADRTKMVYTQATLLELQRWATIVPLGVMRYTMEDTTVQGYDVPKGTPVIFNLWAMQHDERFFADPLKFDPTRFIDSQGQVITKMEGYAPFAMGKRACPADILAHVQVFIFFTALMQRFQVLLPDDKPPNLQPKSGVGLNLETQHNILRLVERNV